MTNAVHHDLAVMLAAAACAAGKAVLGIYGTDFSVASKDDASPVTEADTRAEEIILAHLARGAGGIPVISEERDGRSPGSAAERFFLVDPLDGTREFVNRNGEFTVNIALVEKGRPVAGVVLAPAVKRLFVAAGPDAAFEAEDAVGGKPESWRPLRVAAAEPDNLRVLTSRSHADQETAAFLETLHAGSLIPAGSSLKFCLIASGEADLYPRFGRTMEWDTAAGHAVLAAAGGMVVTREGAPLAYGKPGYENPAFIASGEPLTR